MDLAAGMTMTTRGGIQRQRWRRRQLGGGGGIQPRGRHEDKDVAVSRQRQVEIPAPTVTRAVENLGFEFMVCRSKNVLYNSVNPFYQLANNCKINNNSIINVKLIT
jgi:hypothetical protein